MRASVAGKPMDGTRWHAREASDATDAIARGANLGTRSRARSRDPLAGGTHAGSRDRTFRGAQTVSIRVDASSMTTISRGTCHSHVRVKGDKAGAPRTEKKTKRQLMNFGHRNVTDDVVEEWNDRRRAARRVSRQQLQHVLLMLRRRCMRMQPSYAHARIHFHVDVRVHGPRLSVHEPQVRAAASCLHLRTCTCLHLHLHVHVHVHLHLHLHLQLHVQHVTARRKAEMIGGGDTTLKCRDTNPSVALLS